MYILDASRLRDDLVHNRVSTADFAIYAFLVAGVSLPIWVPHRAQPYSWSVALEYGASIAHLVVAAYGTRACYIANGRSAGRDFLNRFVSLGWVIGARVALVLAIQLSLLYIFAFEVSPAIADEVLNLALLGGAALYYWRLSLQIQLVQEAARLAAAD